MNHLMRRAAVAAAIASVMFSPVALSDGSLKDMLWNTVKDVAKQAVPQMPGSEGANAPTNTQVADCRDEYEPRVCALTGIPAGAYVVNERGIGDVNGAAVLLYFMALQGDPSGGANVRKLLGEELRYTAAMPDRYGKGNAFDRRDLQQAAEQRAEDIEATLKGKTFVFPASMRFFDYDFATHSFPVEVRTGIYTAHLGRNVVIERRFRDIPATEGTAVLEGARVGEPNFHLVVTDEGKARRALERLRKPNNPVMVGLQTRPIGLLDSSKVMSRAGQTTVVVELEVTGFSFVDYRGHPIDLFQ